MRVLLTSEARFERTPDGVVWGSAANAGAAWNRYLDVFSGVLVAARISDVLEPSSGCVQASSPGIGFCALPPYSGLGGLVRTRQAVRAAVIRAIHACPAVIVRSPSPVAYLAARCMLAAGRPYGAQIVGDPDQVFSAGAFRHPLRVPLRYAATFAQKRVTRHASAVLFVTKQTLQRKYPAAGRVFAGSDVMLDETAFDLEWRRDWPDTDPFTLVTVAALDQPYKGVAVLLDAVQELRRIGRLVKLVVVGGGVLLPQLQARARSLGIGDSVDFMGQLDREGVRRALDSAHLFVMPSLTEGLPRALLEAMARGLPAVATNVGGIPELLPADWLVRPQDSAALARRIDELMTGNAPRRAMGERNRQVAWNYHERVQTSIKRAFLTAVRDVSVTSHDEAACA
jgi:phosphatidylinositol alpha-1,6-mannosyltransferase